MTQIKAEEFWSCRANQLQDNKIIEGRTLIIPVGTRDDAIASLPQTTVM